jgi:HAE1 family hydrophobic/amphiphilic exporter-1
MSKTKNYGESGSCEPKVPLFYKSLQSDANAVAVSEELVKTIAKLEYKRRIKTRNCQRQYFIYLEADAVVHDLLIAVLLVAL